MNLDSLATKKRREIRRAVFPNVFLHGAILFFFFGGGGGGRGGDIIRIYSSYTFSELGWLLCCDGKGEGERGQTSQSLRLWSGAWSKNRLWHTDEDEGITWSPPVEINGGFNIKKIAEIYKDGFPASSKIHFGSSRRAAILAKTSAIMFFFFVWTFFEHTWAKSHVFFLRLQLLSSILTESLLSTHGSSTTTEKKRNCLWSSWHRLAQANPPGQKRIRLFELWDLF